MNYLLLRLKRNLLKINCFYFVFEFFTNHHGISAELIIITKNSLFNEFLDMSFHREVNVRHKRISVARKTLRNCAKRFLKITNLICLVLDGVTFYKKCFLGWKVKPYIQRIKFSKDEKEKQKKKIKLSAYRKSGTQDSKVGPGPATLVGTLWWDPKVGPQGGTLWWDLMVGP